MNYIDARSALKAIELEVNRVAAQLSGDMGDRAAQTKLDSLELKARPLRAIVTQFEEQMQKERQANDIISKSRSERVVPAETYRLVNMIKEQVPSGTGVIMFVPDETHRDEILSSIAETDISILDLGKAILASAHFNLDFLADAMEALETGDRMAVANVLTGQASIAVLKSDYDEEVLDTLRVVFCVTRAYKETLITFSK